MHCSVLIPTSDKLGDKPGKTGKTEVQDGRDHHPTEEYTLAELHRRTLKRDADKQRLRKPCNQVRLLTPPHEIQPKKVDCEVWVTL